MRTNNRIYIYNRKLPFFVIPALIFLGLLIFSIFALFGLFIAVILGTLAIGGFLLRLLTKSNRLDSKRLEDNGRTIVLDKEEYEVLDKKR